MYYVLPIFLECREWTLDPYWMDIFMKCAMGKFPKGIRIGKNNNLFLIRDKVTENINVCGDSFEVFQRMMRIFKDELGLMSDMDIQKQKEDTILLKQKIKETYNCSWKQIKPKSIKRAILLQYVINCKKEYKLSQKQTEHLYSLINLGIIFKKVTSSNIKYSEGRIHSIDGLSFVKSDPPNKGSVDIEFTVYNKHGKKLEKVISDDIRINKSIERYIKEYRSQVIRA